jgi:rhodanese-related sulfurtransferase
MVRTTIEELLERARSRLERLEPDQALGAQHAGALIVDLRSHDERARHGIIPGSLHVPRAVLEWRLDPDSPHRNPHASDLEQHVILVCSDGYSSSLAAATLQELGFARATDLVGGFNAWRSRGLPIAPAQPVDDGVPGMGAPMPPTPGPGWEPVHPSAGPMSGIGTCP